MTSSIYKITYIPYILHVSSYSWFRESTIILFNFFNFSLLALFCYFHLRYSLICRNWYEKRWVTYFITVLSIWPIWECESTFLVSDSTRDSYSLSKCLRLYVYLHTLVGIGMQEIFFREDPLLMTSKKAAKAIYLFSSLSYTLVST